MTRSSARGKVAPFYVMEVVKAAAERQVNHGDAIALCVGQPGTPAPAVVRQAAIAAIEADVLGYTVSTGLSELRAQIAADYARAYQLRIDPDEVIVTTGSSAGFQLAVLAAFEPGDTVVMSSPGYPAYRNTLLSLGCEVVELPLGPDSNFQPTAEALAELPVVPAGLVIASPANPTGAIIPAAELARIATWCATNDCLLISDEIYHGISYGKRCASAREFTTEAVVLGSVSKYHSMTGWRLGWLLVPPALRRSVELLQSNLAICPPAVSQAAALAAFTPEARVELDQHVARYARNRELLLRRLPELGFDNLAGADGAFYVWLDVSRFTDDSQSWCADLLAATGVALAPGLDFDPTAGHTWARLSFCGQTAELEAALERMAGYLGVAPRTR